MSSYATPWTLARQASLSWLIVLLVCISAVTVVISLFDFLCCLFGSSLCSWWAWPEVCKSCLPFQRTNSWFYWFSFSIFFFLNCSIVNLQCVSDVQQRDSVIYVYVYVYIFFFRFFFLIDYYKILAIVSMIFQLKIFQLYNGAKVICLQ